MINDDKLIASGVNFLPWIGNMYEFGIYFDEDGNIQYGTKEHLGSKLLVLGEFHYCADENDAFKELTRNIISDFINPKSDFEPYKNIYTKFSRALVGQNSVDKQKLWNHLAFYNYVQDVMTGPRIMPSSEQYKKSEEAFFSVLNELKPDYVIVWGVRLYNNLPQKGMQGENIIGDYMNFETWKYENVSLLPIINPSAAFSISDMHNVIVKFFNLKEYESNI